MIYSPRDGNENINSEEVLEDLKNKVVNITVKFEDCVESGYNIGFNKLLKRLSVAIPQLNDFFDNPGKFLFRGFTRPKKDGQIRDFNYQEKHGALINLILTGKEFKNDEDNDFYLTDQLDGEFGLAKYLRPRVAEKGGLLLPFQFKYEGFDSQVSFLIIYNNQDERIDINGEGKVAVISDGYEGFKKRIEKIIIINWV